MTSRSKNSVRTYETDIEKSREESNWKKAVELAQQLKARSPQHESLAHFLIGEGKLEVYLDEWPPIKENIERAQRELSEPKGYLTLATDEAGKKAGVALDAHLLLGKLHFACGSYDDALKHYKFAELNTLTEKELPVRSLRIVAESYAIKGLCLEQSVLPSSTSKFKQAECEAELIRSFELASELTLLYLQRASAARAGATLETALQRAPLLHIRAGRLTAAIDRYREMLTAVESVATQALRLTLARQLAEVLMRGVTGQVGVQSPARRVPADRRNSEQAQRGTSLGRTLETQEVRRHQPVRAPQRARGGGAVSGGGGGHGREGRRALAERGVRGRSSPLFAQRRGARGPPGRRRHALGPAAAAAGVVGARDEVLVRVRPHLAAESPRHGRRLRARLRAGAAGSSAAEASPSWNAHVRAVSVARRAAPLVPHDAPLRLVAATTAFRAGWIEEGIELAEQALSAARARPDTPAPRLARCYLHCAIGHQMKAQKTNSRIEKDAENEVCLKYLVQSVQLDDNDHLAFYHLALQYVHQGMLNEAMDATRACLSCRAECGGGLRLAASLWSCAAAGPRGSRALHAARLARHHYPTAEWPLWTLAALQLLWEGGEAALATGKELLRLLNGAEEADGEQQYAELDALSDSLRDDPHSVRDAASVRAESAGAYRVERALSENASTLSQRARSPLADHRAHAWLLLADLCLRLGRTSAAAGCVSEAAALTPFSHLVLYTRGRVHSACGEWEEARQCYQNALAIHPTHVDTMLQLGGAYYSLGWLRLAERTLREAGALEPGRADTWRRLALVLGALGEPAAAADAAAAALALHPLTPLCPDL